ncbi:hypothetical protein N7532_009916 [Penicillium argentinense]|uniref:Alpha-1,6-mannosyltransferase subunit n=1 Tax=Penicillium argentinense TaxID=1131581 RepID=A0A9W9ENS7_9EURO|nr:uncharacterized protein N7532_009916 [Penicillium argentinense]KAJ5085145.1 hypothetical protein N7532_009916 [Penicillium argentinense]
MSLSRSPSPHPGGGWSSPGLTPGSGSSTPAHGYAPNTLAPNSAAWAAAKAKSDGVRGYPSFSTRNSGFFSRQKHKITGRLPSFHGHQSLHGYVDKDLYGRERWRPLAGGARGALVILLRRSRVRLVLGLLLAGLAYFLFLGPLVHLYRRSPLSGAHKFVIILGSNVEGGVMELKGAREWAIERNSIANKEQYVGRWGYKLEVANMLAQKRYSHEWRESWEKGDVIREAMRKYPKAEWFWWLDLNTWIMQQDTSLQGHIFSQLNDLVYRDINTYNPLNVTHPLPDFYLDEVGRALEGDGKTGSLNMLLTQDCAGFNLGSFFLRRSLWTERLLDALWDPVMYEQMHMAWEHNEQSALEWIYQSQPWVRSSIGFLPQRTINSFPLGACGDENNQDVHYQEEDNDFVVNMAGCAFGRDCWAEVVYYRAIARRLNRTFWEKLTGGLSAIYEMVFGNSPQSDT